MDYIVKEFEREYANGNKLPYVRAFVNKYCIQGGQHARDQVARQKQDDERTRQRILEKKLALLEYILQ